MPFSVENKETASAPCLSLWERCLSEAKTERGNRDCQGGYANTYNSANFDGSFY